MENTPIEPGPAGLGPAGQQAETIRVDQLYRQQLRQIGQALGLGTGNLELGFAPCPWQARWAPDAPPARTGQTG